MSCLCLNIKDPIFFIPISIAIDNFKNLYLVSSPTSKVYCSSFVEIDKFS